MKPKRKNYLAGYNKERKEKIVFKIFDLIKNNLDAFVESVLDLKNKPFHNEIDKVLSDDSYKKSVIAIPRGFGKSQHCSVAFPLWLIAKNHNIRILIVSASAQIAKSFLKEIISTIEKNERYKVFAQTIDPNKKGVIPRTYDKRKIIEDWNSNSITIERENWQKDPTISTIGIFGSILSKRTDVVILDDIVNQQNSETEDQRKKIKEWIYTTIMPTLVPGGRLVCVGTTWHIDDIVSDFLKSPQFDYRKKLKSIVKEPENKEIWQNWANVLLNEEKDFKERREESENFYQRNMEEMERGVEVLWPERFPYRDLFLSRIQDFFSFERMYQCDVSSRPTQVFKEEWIKNSLDKGKNFVLGQEEKTNYIKSFTTVGVDLAISEKKISDDTVILILDKVKIGDNELIKTGDYVIRDIWRGKFSPNQVREKIKEIYHLVKPNGIRVESVGYQMAIVRDLNEAGVPVRGYNTGGEKRDPAIGVNSLANVMELGNFVIPYGEDIKTKELSIKLINEMRNWPEGHLGDSLAALWFAFSEMRDLDAMKYTIPKSELEISQYEIMSPEEKKNEETKLTIEQAKEKELERAMFNRGHNFWKNR